MEKDNRTFITINVRAPKTLKDIMIKYILADTHTNISEFVRAAIREKIQRDAPHLLQLKEE